MHQRCNNPNNKKYSSYGARGIKICKEWEDFEIFKKWAKKNGYNKGLSIERVNVNGGYNPNNCTWIPNKDQAKNKRNTSKFLINGEWIIQADLAIKLGVSPTAIKKMALGGRLQFEKWDRGSNVLGVPI